MPVFSPVLTRREFLLLLLITLVLLPRLRCAGSRKQTPGINILFSGQSNTVTEKVLTTDGKECKFPFRFGGVIYHQCISMNSHKAWCSLTHNFDRDQKWGFCSSQARLFNGFLPPRRGSSLCRQNPCLNGGVCATAAHLNSFDCVCPDGFTGALCEKKKCYEPLHLKYYDTGDSWGRIYLRSVELCTCLSGGVSCERARYTVCSRNRCENNGVCRMIEATGEEVCGCVSGYNGQYCNINPGEQCYRDSGALYRGVASVTVSGSSCLPWNSDLLFTELTVETVESAPHRGLGGHAFCRNPDQDKLPWCYTVTGRAVSWEYCAIEPCSKPALGRRSPVLTVAPGPSRRPVRTPACGKRQEKRISRGRILGGTSALPGAHPWMAALYIADEFCAGTLVSSCWIVSAAHCFLRNPLKSQIRVVLGQHSFNDTGPNTRTFAVQDYILYPRYTQFEPTLNDIALVKLKKVEGRCALKTPFIRPICLPEKDMTFPDHSCCKISGWGHMHEKANSYSHLMEGVVKIIPFDQCSSPDVYGSEVRSGMLCAGSESCVDACQGDSGGPLACDCDGVSFLYGIISWGDGCGRSGKPGVYTLVPKYSVWINSVIKKSRKTSVNRTTIDICIGSQCQR
ncbi:hepatocyte growth factor activator-like isoform X1 [Sinocyclocheilus grahami]|uniref:hepatocyte growth factor activator-like isoform X1 n=2 Tax=Sinocyclocheilus grahami TaxID=75366 RepID=UPI0007ACC657|nr:PREDICTED: hepatocyte growth factor activator-like isoform X1 [Sinocyclocheilus grahami]